MANQKMIILHRITNKRQKAMEKLDLQDYIEEQRKFCASTGADRSALTMERSDVIVTIKLKFKQL